MKIKFDEYYALRSIMVTFYSYRTTDFDLGMPGKDFRRKKFCILGM
jgi:hypothetical protein